MKIFLRTDDLMSRVRIESRWKNVGLEVIKRSTEENADLVVIDLESQGAINHINRLRSQRPGVRIIAYGPHVDGAAFRTAREAGADEVVAKGKVVDRVLKQSHNI